MHCRSDPAVLRCRMWKEPFDKTGSPIRDRPQPVRDRRSRPRPRPCASALSGLSDSGWKRVPGNRAPFREPDVFLEVAIRFPPAAVRFRSRSWRAFQGERRALLDAMRPDSAEKLVKNRTERIDVGRDGHGFANDLFR